jgi:hypothetical protein
MTSTELAKATCFLLKPSYPDAAFEHYDPVEFYHDFFEVPGLPLVSEDYFAVWELPGELFYLEASGIYSWDAMKCDFTSFKAANRSDSGAAMLFLHEDGRVAFVDEDDGSLSTIGENFSVEDLVQTVQLFFDKGRMDLATDEAHFTGALNTLRSHARSYQPVTGNEKSALPDGGYLGLSQTEILRASQQK